MTASVLTSLTLGRQNSFFNAGGVGPAKFNIPTDPWAKYVYIYIYICIIFSMTWRWRPSHESKIIKSRLIFNHFTHFPRQIRCQFGLQLIRGVPDPHKNNKKIGSTLVATSKWTWPYIYIYIYTRIYVHMYIQYIYIYIYIYTYMSQCKTDWHAVLPLLSKTYV